MKFPGRRKNKHFFPIADKERVDVSAQFALDESFHIVGIDQLLVDIECKVDDDFLTRYGLRKGQSQLIEDQVCDEIYRNLKAQNRVAGEFAGGTVGNTLHNFCTLSEERAVSLGAISRNITVGDYAFKYISSTSSKVDLNHLQPSDLPMGRAICFVTPDGERTFGISQGCMNQLTPDSIPASIIEKSSALLISAYLLRNKSWPIFQATLKACEIAKAADVPIVLNLGTSSLIEENRDFFIQFIKDHADVVAMNLEEATALTEISDPLLSLEKVLEWTSFALLTVGAHGLYIGAYVDQAVARPTEQELRSKSIARYNEFEYSRGMRKIDCLHPIKIYSHINPYLGGPQVIRNTNGAGDGALSAVLHDIAANRYHRVKVPKSPKHNSRYLTYSSLSQICKYANRVSFEILSKNSPRLARGLPEREESLDEAYWAT